MDRTPDQIETELLVLRVQGGDRAALGLLFARWDRRLRVHAARLVGPELAGEAAQEAWLGIVRGIGSLADPARFGAWAYRVTGNKAADLIRRARRQRRALRVLGERGGAEPVNRDGGPSDWEGDAMGRALRGLPEPHRTVLVLHVVDGLSTAEIGEALGIPPGTVKSRLFHARAMVRAGMEAHDERAGRQDP